MTTSTKSAAKTTKATEGKKPAVNSAFMKPVTPTGPLVAIIGATPMPRTEVTKKVWEYIKSNNLQNPQNKRMIVADAKLQPLFGKPEATMFELTKFVSQYLKA